jgi:hypothetical protein
MRFRLPESRRFLNVVVFALDGKTRYRANVHQHGDGWRAVRSGCITSVRVEPVGNKHQDFREVAA